MVTVHHLNNSRSQRIVWLLEELGIPYDVVGYQRDPVTNLAPDSLKQIHPLGKSPVITDGELVLVESGAIIEYLVRTYGEGRLAPPPSSPSAIRYLELMHYAEGSAMLPILLSLYVGRLGDAGAPLWPRIDSETRNHLSFLETALGTQPFFLGEDFTACDVQLTFVLEAAHARNKLQDYPRLTAYLDRVQSRPAYQRAIDRGGPYKLGR